MTKTKPTIWITGAARRIGRAISLACAKEGARIVVHYNTSRDDAEETATLIRQAGGSACLIQANLCCMTEIESAVREVTSHWTQIDALIHNAAVFFPTPFGETGETDWDTILGSNLKGPYFLTQALLPALQKSGKPSVIFLGDESTTHPAARLIPYAISKEGLRTFSEGLKRLYPMMNIRFIDIGPTLPPEDTRLKTPIMTQSVDDVVQKVVLSLP